MERGEPPDRAAGPDRAAAGARRRSRPVRRNRHSTNCATDHKLPGGSSALQLRRTVMRPVKIQRSGIVGITGKIALVLVTLVFGGIDLRAQQPQPPGTGEAEKGSFLLTIFFRHDEPKTLDQINAQLKAQ